MLNQSTHSRVATRPPPGCATARGPDDLGLEQADHRFGESVVEAVPDAADGRLDAGLGETLGVVIERIGWIHVVVATPGRRVVAMAGRRRSDRALRAKLRSPGRPGVARREDRRQFWALIAAGQSSWDAAIGVGVSEAVGSRWFREAGGMPPSTLARSSKSLSGRYLSFAEREEIALWRAQGHGVREVARRLGRAASTISRELRRNAATRGGGLEYRATTAQWHAERAARRPKRAKLALNPALGTYVQERLAGHVAAPGGATLPGPTVPWKGRRHGRRQNRRWGMAWQPQQIAERLRLDFPELCRELGDGVIRRRSVLACR